MCSHNSDSCSVLKFFIYTFVLLFCVVYLILATYEAKEYGPNSNPFSVSLESLTFRNLSYNNSTQKLAASWTAELVMIARNPSLNMTMLPFRAYALYEHVPFSPGSMNKTLHLGKVQRDTFLVAGDPQEQDLEKVFEDSSVRSDFAHRLEAEEKLRIDINMMVYGYYQHHTWAWEVVMEPFCSGLNLIRKEDQHEWSLEGNGTEIHCAVPNPGWYV